MGDVVAQWVQQQEYGLDGAPLHAPYQPACHLNLIHALSNGGVLCDLPRISKRSFVLLSQPLLRPALAPPPGRQTLTPPTPRSSSAACLVA